MFSWLFFGPMLSRYDHKSPYFSIVTYVIPTLLGRLRHLPFVQKMLDNAFIHEVCIFFLAQGEQIREFRFSRVNFVIDCLSLTHLIISVCSNGSHFYRVIILIDFCHSIHQEPILALVEDFIFYRNNREVQPRYRLAWIEENVKISLWHFHEFHSFFFVSSFSFQWKTFIRFLLFSSMMTTMIKVAMNELQLFFEVY